MLGALVVMGVPPSEARAMDFDLAHRILETARRHRPDVDAFLVEHAMHKPLPTMPLKDYLASARGGAGHG